MEVTFDGVQVVCVTTHPTNPRLIAIGLITGSIQVGEFDLKENTVTWKWENRLRREVRSLTFSHDGQSLYVLGKNRSLSTFDTETGQRIRVVVESHQQPPTAISLLPLSDSKTGQQLATGDESGVIRTWDFTAKDSVICEFKEQEEMINDLKPYENRLLASSSDATLGCYDYRRRKLYVRSEPVESELLNICVTETVTYVGSGTGHLQVFNNGEYGNLLERVNTKLEHGVDAVAQLRSNLLVVGCALDDKIWLQNIKPTKRLQYIGEQSGGVDQLLFTCDKNYLISVGSESSITVWDVEEINKSIPVLTSKDVKELKKAKTVTEKQRFFDDLMEKSESEDSAEDEEIEIGDEEMEEEDEE
uniref:WD repeat-containing protein 55 homolog n=1 Tax=Steinernema glaseri TaxID=37863 RepID=A0A1I7ZVQ9_9BILA